MADGELDSINNSPILEIFVHYEMLHSFAVYCVKEYYFEDGAIVIIKTVRAFVEVD